VELLSESEGAQDVFILPSQTSMKIGRRLRLLSSPLRRQANTLQSSILDNESIVKLVKCHCPSAVAVVAHKDMHKNNSIAFILSLCGRHPPPLSRANMFVCPCQTIAFSALPRKFSWSVCARRSPKILRSQLAIIYSAASWKYSPILVIK